MVVAAVLAVAIVIDGRTPEPGIDGPVVLEERRSSRPPVDPDDPVRVVLPLPTQLGGSDCGNRSDDSKAGDERGSDTGEDAGATRDDPAGADDQGTGNDDRTGDDDGDDGAGDDDGSQDD